MSLHFSKAGFANTVQDLGRWGFQSQGVPVGGAMDDDALIKANLLVGNEVNEACIEFLIGESEIKFESDTLIALGGMGSNVLIGEDEIPYYKTVLVKSGAILNFKHTHSGMWKYLAVGGGFALDKTLNSYSTYCPAGFGGLNGRWLKDGNKILIKKNKSDLTKAIEASLKCDDDKNFCAAKWGISNPNTEGSNSIRIMAGHEWDWLSDVGKEIITKMRFIVGFNSNRMGYRLMGEKVDRINNSELISTAVTKGTIQLTNDGKLIVLMADGQTIGGYPRVGQVALVDLPKLAQKRIGEEVCFKMISFDEAERLFLMREKEYEDIKQSIKMKFPG